MGLQIQAFDVRGERCSGTTYLERLIDINLQLPYTADMGWKHSYLNLYALKREKIDMLLVVVIFRDPFDWMRSLYLQPHHFQNTCSGRWLEGKQPTFSDFIRNEVKLADDFGEEMFGDRHPVYLDHPKNILELRKWKIEAFLNLPKILKNVVYVRYEDLASDPKKIISEINEKYIKRDFEFKDWVFYKKADPGQEEVIYEKKKYFDISSEDYSFIVDNIDWELEAKIGYFKP